MAKAKSKQVYMSPALTGLESTMKENGGSFSARLGEIVERYQMILDLEELPEFSEDEMEILNEVIWSNIVDRRKVRGLHLDVLDAATGTQAARDALSAKVAEMTAGQRLKLIESIGQ